MKNSDENVDYKSSFWKKNDKNVPGRPVSSNAYYQSRKDSSFSPKKDFPKSKHKKNSSCSSFQDFQESTNDAWDIGDDDVCIVSDVTIHPKVAHSAAMTVITNHSKGKLSMVSSLPNSDGSNLIASDAKVAAMQRLATQKDPTTISNNVPEKALSHSSHPPGPGIGVRLHRPPITAYTVLSHSSNIPGSSEREAEIRQKFKTLLNSPNTDLEELANLSWKGVPYKVRPLTWKLLSGYLPASSKKWDESLKRRREEYASFLIQYYETRNEDIHQETYRQIHIDVPRMSPLVPLFQQKIVQEAFERILYIWAIRHPASGYVQGMNDLVTPFFVVFLQEFVSSELEVETYEVSNLSSDLLQQVEADSFWCMTKLLDGIQDNYTFAQPGIQRKVNTLKELIQRIDAPLHNHLTRHSVEYLQFSFRWMNNILMRELPLRCTIRLWDTYLAEANGFSCFHLYVCAAFLTHWSKELLQERDFQGLMIMLQNLPTLHWGDNEIQLLVAEAYRLKYMFDDAPNHLQLKT